jgi:polyisoprenoid-binding protein YceI
MPATLPITEMPGYIAGTWKIDPVHSDVSFSVRHLMVSKVRGRFGRFEGEIVTGEDPLTSQVLATIEVGSIDTANGDRDTHLRSADFFDAEQYPLMTYRSTGVRPDGDRFVVDGELGFHGVTQLVPLVLEVNGFQPKTPFGDSRVGFSATAEIDRRDFGINFNAVLDAGGVALGTRVQIALEIEAILQADAA